MSSGKRLKTAGVLFIAISDTQPTMSKHRRQLFASLLVSFYRDSGTIMHHVTLYSSVIIGIVMKVCDWFFRYI